MRISAIAACLAASLLAAPALAEVAESDGTGFVTRDAVEVAASPKEVWLALIAPKNWWNPAHTWSGDPANLTLVPKAGGCFCERIPENLDPDRIALEGSVEHMRVIQAYPERALRMQGALGPLQSEAVTGILTIAISKSDEGARIVWEYAVGGRMRFEIPVIAKAVDGVMSEQLSGLARILGRTEEPKAVGRAGPEPGPAVDASEADQALEDAPEQGLGDAIDAMGQNKDPVGN